MIARASRASPATAPAPRSPRTACAITPSAPRLSSPPTPRAAPMSASIAWTRSSSSPAGPITCPTTTRPACATTAPMPRGDGSGGGGAALVPDGARGVTAPGSAQSSAAAPSDDWPALRARRRRWAELLRRVFDIEIHLCPSCAGAMHIVAFVTAQKAVRRILAHLERRDIDARARPWADAAAARQARLSSCLEVSCLCLRSRAPNARAQRRAAWRDACALPASGVTRECVRCSAWLGRPGPDTGSR